MARAKLSGEPARGSRLAAGNNVEQIAKTYSSRQSNLLLREDRAAADKHRQNGCNRYRVKRGKKHTSGLVGTQKREFHTHTRAVTLYVMGGSRRVSGFGGEKNLSDERPCTDERVLVGPKADELLLYVSPWSVRERTAV